MRVHIFLAFYFSAVFAVNLSVTKRGLADAFDPFQGPTEQRTQAQETHLEHATERTTETHPSGSPTGTLSLPALLSSLESSTAKETSAGSRTQTTTGIPTASNALATSTTQSTPSSASTASIQPTTTASPIVLPSPSPSKPSGGQSISRGSQEWKLIGVAVIAFSTVAAILLLSVFFDQWWGFIRDLVWKKKRKDRYEEFIPDWEKASWEIKMNGEHDRYPTMPSPTKNRAFERDHDQDMEKGFNDPFHAEYMTGVGSGFANRLPTPQPTYNVVNGLGILTPLPQAHYPGHSPARAASLNRSRSQRHASVVMTDPYGGIE